MQNKATNVGKILVPFQNITGSLALPKGIHEYTSPSQNRTLKWGRLQHKTPLWIPTKRRHPHKRSSNDGRYSKREEKAHSGGTLPQIEMSLRKHFLIIKKTTPQNNHAKFKDGSVNDFIRNENGRNECVDNRAMRRRQMFGKLRDGVGKGCLARMPVWRDTSKLLPCRERVVKFQFRRREGGFIWKGRTGGWRCFVMVRKMTLLSSGFWIKWRGT